MGIMSFVKHSVAKRSASFILAAALRFLGIGMSEDEGAMAAAAEDLATMAAGGRRGAALRGRAMISLALSDGRL